MPMEEILFLPELIVKNLISSIVNSEVNMSLA